MPDELTDVVEAPEDRRGGPPAAPPVAAGAAPAPGRRPPRRPSWLRALVFSLVVLAAGSGLGAAGYRLERTYSVRVPHITRTAGGWHIRADHYRLIAGLALDGPRLVFQYGPSVEYIDLRTGRARLLGPGPGMHATWQPSVGERYALWFEAERTASVAAQAIAYDTFTGRRWVVADVGIPYSFPALSGDTAVWCSAPAIGSPGIQGVRIGAGTPLHVADGTGTPDVSDGLAVWATGDGGPFTARELSGGAAWPVVPKGRGGKLTGIALAGRVLAWGQTGSDGSGSVSLTNVDTGRTTVVAAGVSGLVGPSFDGKTVAWVESPGTVRTGASPGPDAERRIMTRPGAGGEAVIVATTGVPVTAVAVSGSTVAWLESYHGESSIEITELPR